MGRVSHKPVSPVEDPPGRRSRRRPAEGNEGLNEGQDECGHSKHSVRILHDKILVIRPASHIQNNTDKSSNGCRPYKGHEESVPYEPLVLPTAGGIFPGVFEIPGQDCS